MARRGTLRLPQRHGGGPEGIEINEEEAAIIREIYRRFANGQSGASIVRWINTQGVKPPRGTRAWAGTTVRTMLRRDLYRGVLIWNSTGMVYGREAPKGRERAQRARPAEEWTRRARPDLRIVDEVTVAAVDARLAEVRDLYVKGKATGRAPHKGRGQYLLSGGMLICPDCGGHFETRNAKEGNRGGTYRCATRRDDKDRCPNRLSLPIQIMDAAVLNVLEGEVLGERYIAELLSLVEAAPADEGERLTAERDRLRGEIANLVKSVAKGMPAETIAPVVRDFEAEIAKLDVAIAQPRPPAVDKARLGEALEQRTKEWRAALRAEPEVARVMLRRLIGPITLWHEEAVPDFIKRTGDKGHGHIGEGDILWGADIKPEAIADGLVGVPLSRWRS